MWGKTPVETVLTASRRKTALLSLGQGAPPPRLLGGLGLGLPGEELGAASTTSRGSAAGVPLAIVDVIIAASCRPASTSR